MGVGLHDNGQGGYSFATILPHGGSVAGTLYQTSSAIEIVDLDFDYKGVDLPIDLSFMAVRRGAAR